MADQFPCPNPACAHVFSLAALQTAATVSCPRCGFRMQGRGAAPTQVRPTAPAAPLATPVGGTIITAQLAPPAPPVTPRAQPVQPEPPKSPPARPAPPRAADIDVDLVAGPVPVPAPPRPVSPNNRRLVTVPAAPLRETATSKPAPAGRDGTRAVLRVLIIVGVVGMSFCLVSGGLVAILVGFGFSSFDEIMSLQAFKNIAKQPSTDHTVFMGKARNLKGGEETAFKLLLTKNIWTPDKELKQHLGALGAWMNKQDDLWVAVAVKDYGMQKPRDAELVQLGMERLEQHFGDGLELAAKTEAVDFAGPPAQKLTFKGQLGAVRWWGECIMFSHHGFGYWVFVAGPTIEDIQPLENELKNEDTGFSLVTDRKGWREQPPAMETFASADGTLRLTAPEGVWEKSVPANVEFETGTLLLLGRYLKVQDNTKNAHLQSFTLDQQADLKDAMKQAKDYLEKIKKEQNTGYKLAPVADGPGKSELGMVDDVGNKRGRVAELMLSLNEAPMRYYLVAVISESNHITVLLCDCNWKSRQIWRQEFLGLLKTLKVSAKG